MNNNLEKEYLKGNKLKMTVARTFTAVIIICCVFYSIIISGWGTKTPDKPESTEQEKYYADPEMVQNSVWDPHGVLNNSTPNEIKSKNRDLLEQYYVRAVVALVGQSEMAGSEIEDYAADYFDRNNLGYNDTLMVINVDNGDYWVQFGNGIYNHAISDKNYEGDYFDKFEGSIDSGNFDGAAWFHVESTARMYDNYEASTNNLSYSSYYDYIDYDYGISIFSAVIILTVIIIVIAAIASSAGVGRRYRYVTYYPHRRKFRPNHYNFHRHQNRHIHHMHGSFWMPKSGSGHNHSSWGTTNNMWNSNNSGRNNSGGGFGSKSGQSNWSSNNRSSNSSGRTNSGGGFGRTGSSGGRSNSGGGFGRSSGGGRGSSGGGFGRKK